ncbi:MAG: Nif3-like dinuclear metal center hexameric protein [Spirochaetae bacterium HGW-Spirochaetae-5]|nr:MAG: Nif3-like dinuclear metal center hexameric protein [Spirochaetae bacterium HGW-Spirochaetae-5]
MKINEIIKRLNHKFPEYIQETYDNTGVQILFDDEILSGIYICLDADINTVKDAVKKKCNLIISHHPLIFRPVKKIISSESRSEIVIEMISTKISLYSMHTNFDRIMYKALSNHLGYEDCIPLIKAEDVDNIATGFGSFVVLENNKRFSEVLSSTRERLNLDYLIYSGDEDRLIRSIALINGSGGGSIEKIIGIHNPDCIITGDVGYHHVKYAIDSGAAVIDAGHYGTEYIFKKLLAESAGDVLYDEKVPIVISDVEKNPFKVYK